GAADVVVSGAGLGVENQAAKRIIGMQLELTEKRLVHGGLRRLLRGSGRGPDGNATAIRRKKKGFCEAVGGDVLEKAVKAIHEEINGETAAVRERMGVVGVEDIGEGPLLLGAVAIVVDEQCAAVERGENLRASGSRIEAISEEMS